MIDVEVSTEAVTAVDAGKNEVTIQVEGWDSVDDAPPLPRRVDTALTATTGGLTFPEAVVSIESTATSDWTVIDEWDGPLELPGGDHLFKIGATIDIYLVVSAACTGSRNRDGTFTINFETPVPVTLGFRSPIHQPRESITVPRTLEGVVSAIRHQSSAIETDSPDKSYPTKRYHPPVIEFGRVADIPESVDRSTTISGIRVRVPPSLEPLLVTAPLVYYLQADIEVAPVDAVQVDAPTLPDSVVLGEHTFLERDVAALLQQVFFLDCLVRNAGPYGVTLRELELLDELGLDMDRIYPLSGAERFAHYLRADPVTVTSWLPDWHLSFVMKPSFANVRAVPYLLDRLSLVQVPRPVSVGRQAVITESVKRSYLARSRPWDDGPPDEMFKNEIRLAERQGWLADAIPIDGFRACLEAFENRFRFHDRSEGPRQVIVVINDDAMRDERAGVEEIYQSRAAELSIEVRVEETPTRDELADVLASPVDFLHYIGHCEPAGLQCADGSVSAASIEETGVQTFFLNACGSYGQGLEFVRRGSVAGAVTLHSVLNPEATRVGLTFARLIMHGFSVNHALSLASRQSITNKFYVVVGDGTHRLSQGDDMFPAELTVERASPGEFDVHFHLPQFSIPGGVAKPAVPGEANYMLRGQPYTVTLPTEAVVGYLADVNVPVTYRREFHWSTELADRLCAEQRAGFPE